VVLGSCISSFTFIQNYLIDIIDNLAIIWWCGHFVDIKWGLSSNSQIGLLEAHFMEVILDFLESWLRQRLVCVRGHNPPEVFLPKDAESSSQVGTVVSVRQNDLTAHCMKRIGIELAHFVVKTANRLIKTRPKNSTYSSIYHGWRIWKCPIHTPHWTLDCNGRCREGRRCRDESPRPLSSTSFSVTRVQILWASAKPLHSHSCHSCCAQRCEIPSQPLQWTVTIKLGLEHVTTITHLPKTY